MLHWQAAGIVVFVSAHAEIAVSVVVYKTYLVGLSASLAILEYSLEAIPTFLRLRRHFAPHYVLQCLSSVGCSVGRCSGAAMLR